VIKNNGKAMVALRRNFIIQHAVLESYVEKTVVVVVVVMR